MSAADPPSSERYTIEKQIGRGAYGIAYVCKNKADGERFVLKKVRLARQSNKERQASLTELLILSNISHRNILKFVEAWVEAGCNACMVVELCECGDLFTQLKSRVPQQHYFNEVHLQDMLVQLASALNFLHTNSIAHRDVKSSNIFITGAGCLKLADFGLATILDEQSQLSRTVVGTPNYMCPELVSEKPYGVKNDIWALGCVMFELSALKPAFQAFNMSGLVKKITSGPTPQLPAHYSEEWRAVVRSMLNKDEEFRPSAADILKLPWLQPAVQRVTERFGPACPEGGEYVEIEDLPGPIAKLAQQFKQQEMDAELKAAEDKAHMKELQAKYAPKALKPRWEAEKKEAEAAAAAVRAKLEKDMVPQAAEPAESAAGLRRPSPGARPPSFTAQQQQPVGLVKPSGRGPSARPGPIGFTRRSAPGSQEEPQEPKKPPSATSRSGPLPALLTGAASQGADLMGAAAVTPEPPPTAAHDCALAEQPPVGVVPAAANVVANDRAGSAGEVQQHGDRMSCPPRMGSARQQASGQQHVAAAVPGSTGDVARAGHGRSSVLPHRGPLARPPVARMLSSAVPRKPPIPQQARPKNVKEQQEDNACRGDVLSREEWQAEPAVRVGYRGQSDSGVTRAAAEVTVKTTTQPSAARTNGVLGAGQLTGQASVVLVQKSSGSLSEMTGSSTQQPVGVGKKAAVPRVSDSTVEWTAERTASAPLA